jgi:hypothetical protein
MMVVFAEETSDVWLAGNYLLAADAHIEVK